MSESNEKKEAMSESNEKSFIKDLIDKEDNKKFIRYALIAAGGIAVTGGMAYLAKKGINGTLLTTSVSKAAEVVSDIA